MPEIAQARFQICPLSGADEKALADGRRDANDPNQTCDPAFSWAFSVPGFAELYLGARRVGSGSNPMERQEPIKIKFHHSNYPLRGFLIDENLDDHGPDELRRWAERKINFVMIDSGTGEDITRIMLA